ncbi:MAG: PLP-dependent transferase, partial [Gemmatimonadetes bacterium]|nr:PLP-dependent transferase [Gemmatimonadota bacterium]
MASSKKPPRAHALATLLLHAGEGPHAAGDPVVAPLVQSVNHVQEPGSEALQYTRYGNTPNADRLQKRLAALEGAEDALVLSSGMGATACGLLALLRPGDHLLASQYLYGG